MLRDMMPQFELYQPDHAGERAEPARRSSTSKAWILAGGYDSLDWFKDRAKRPTAVVDIGGIAELKGIRETAGRARDRRAHDAHRDRAPTRSSAEILAAGAVPRAASRARRSAMPARSAATSARTRAAGTTAPAWTAIAPAATSATPIRRRDRTASTACSARAVVSRCRHPTSAPRWSRSMRRWWSRGAKGERVVPAEEFFIGPATDITHMTALKHGEILTAIRFPQGMGRARSSISRRSPTATPGTSRW